MAFSAVGLSECAAVAKDWGISQGENLPLPKSVADAAKGMSLQPYNWSSRRRLVASTGAAPSAAGAGSSSAAGADSSAPASHVSKRQRTEPAEQEILHEDDGDQKWYDDAAARKLQELLQVHLHGNTVVDIRRGSKRGLKLTVRTNERRYDGFADAAVLKRGYAGEVPGIAASAVIIDWKAEFAFASRAPMHMAHALMELFATGVNVPVVHTDMSTGMRVWIRHGNRFHPFHGKEALTLAEGIALIQYFAARDGKLDDADLPDHLRASGGGKS